MYGAARSRVAGAVIVVCSWGGGGGRTRYPVRSWSLAHRVEDRVSKIVVARRALLHNNSACAKELTSSQENARVSYKKEGYSFLRWSPALRRRREESQKKADERGGGEGKGVDLLTETRQKRLVSPGASRPWVCHVIKAARGVPKSPQETRPLATSTVKKTRRIGQLERKFTALFLSSLAAPSCYPSQQQATRQCTPTFSPQRVRRRGSTLVPYALRCVITFHILVFLFP